jgi:histidinol dehydrogenase
MRFFDTQFTSLAELRSVFASRLTAANTAAEATVRSILEEVRQRGDAALLEYTRRFDFPHADAVRVADTAISEATERVRQTALWPVLEQSAERIRRFHEPQRRASWMDTSHPGETLGQIIRPLRRVGIYVPGGTAAYPSTVLMTAIPASVAGVENIALTTPPNRETGLPPDATLAACRLAGVTEVYAVGGAQAIAGLAYGTESIAPVDKVVGPGSLYANLAKQLVYGVVGIDMLAGPSEVAVLADDAADPAAAAADILTQCEHDPNCSALVATTSASFAAAVREEIARQIADLPRAEIARRALECAGFVVVTASLEEAAEVVNLYAPEHLHVDVREPWALLGRIANAGAILVGRHTSAPLGDYMAGPSHTLPTAGCARYASPLNVDDFVKKMSVLYFDEAAASALSESAAVFAEFEGLEGHARAARRSMRTV